MAFKLSQGTSSVYESPESMFADNKRKRIKGLISYQADVIRKYVEEALDKSDVSIQLATGAGKTLIGAVIGDWLLKTKKERVLYLCPTNQLAKQVSNQLNDLYGIDNVVFTGKISNYSSDMKFSFLNNEKIAITSYSSLFNTNPFFTEADIIIMDDIHQAEGNISNLWSVKINRNEESHTTLFEELISYIQKYLTKSSLIKITTQADDDLLIDKLPTSAFFESIPDLIRIIDAHITTDQVHSWGMIKDHLSACHFYYSINEILIKPIYSPTSDFAPFSNARQRIYMSATLGNSGDLERIVGRKNIFKLPIPPQMQDRTIGRRFFCFPEAGLNDDEVISFNKSVFSLGDRAVYIVPSNYKQKKIREVFSEIEGITIFNAQDIESDKSSFITAINSLLILSNRYDGIDFPNDECRILFIDGLPKATNLQESFYIHKLGLSCLYQARILNRITQAFGRTTRNDNDYSVVCVTGEDVITYLFRQDARHYLLPELRAEIEFGIEQSRCSSIENTIDNIKLFLMQGEEWGTVEKHIISQRDSFSKKPLPDYQIFDQLSKYEINYSEAMWNANYAEALSSCKSILGLLTSPNLRGLRGIWNYYTGSVIHLLNQQGIDVGITPEYVKIVYARFLRGLHQAAFERGRHDIETGKAS